MTTNVANSRRGSLRSPAQARNFSGGRLGSEYVFEDGLYDPFCAFDHICREKTHTNTTEHCVARYEPAGVLESVLHSMECGNGMAGNDRGSGQVRLAISTEHAAHNDAQPPPVTAELTSPRERWQSQFPKRINAEPRSRWCRRFRNVGRNYR